MNINYKFLFYLIVIVSLPSTINASSNLLDNLIVESGFEIEIFVENVDTPRQITESDLGNIFFGSRNAGTISVIDKNKNIRVIANGLSNSTGVTYHEGDLYFSEVDSIWKIPNIDQDSYR